MRRRKLPSIKEYRKKVMKYSLLAAGLLLFSIIAGTFGYMHFFHLGWVDGLYNASMILTGMGPANVAPDDAAKIFSSIYAIYSGVAFLTSVAVLFSPILHRFLHKFHLDLEED